jgi:hypothetical protein
MSKPFTIDDLSNQISSDRTWRIREIIDLSDAVKRADPICRKVLLRALVTICHAHWEGHVRYSAQRYIEHIAIKKLAFSALSVQFTRNHVLPRLSSLSSSKFGLRGKCELVDEILELSAKKFSRINPELINTRSNLNVEIFSDICLICDLPPDLLKDKQIFIDVILLKRRNAIAHGEEAFIDEGDRNDIANSTIELMRRFGDAIENQVYSNSFRR